MSEFIHKWQGLIGSFVGASAPFLLWWFAQKYQRNVKYEEDLYLLERYFVDQINTLLETRDTIEKFINNQLAKLLENIQNNKTTAYSVDQAFFPLFSSRPLAEEIYTINTKSGYLDNKIARVYKLSHDMPYIIDDIRRQFEHTLQLNREMSFSKLNPPDVQKLSYSGNIQRFINTLKSDFLEKNIPTYLKVLIEAREGVNELRKIGYIRWQIRFNPKYRFYIRKKEYQAKLDLLFDDIDSYFECRVADEVAKMEKKSHAI